jgi:hypothetical protein
MNIINWFLEREPYIQYAVRKNILTQDKQELCELIPAVLTDK